MSIKKTIGIGEFHPDIRFKNMYGIEPEALPDEDLEFLYNYVNRDGCDLYMKDYEYYHKITSEYNYRKYKDSPYWAIEWEMIDELSNVINKRIVDNLDSAQQKKKPVKQYKEYSNHNKFVSGKAYSQSKQSFRNMNYRRR